MIICRKFMIMLFQLGSAGMIYLLMAEKEFKLKFCFLIGFPRTAHA